jgi:hypothetical protein
MKCQIIHAGDRTMIVCGRPSKAGRRRCGMAGCRNTAIYQCDWKMGNGTTCDAFLCRTHARTVAPNKELCPAHQATFEAWLAAHPDRGLHAP